MERLNAVVSELESDLCLWAWSRSRREMAESEMWDICAHLRSAATAGTSAEGCNCYNSRGMTEATTMNRSSASCQMNEPRNTVTKRDGTMRGSKLRWMGRMRVSSHSFLYAFGRSIALCKRQPSIQSPGPISLLLLNASAGKHFYLHSSVPLKWSCPSLHLIQISSLSRDPTARLLARSGSLVFRSSVVLPYH